MKYNANKEFSFPILNGERCWKCFSYFLVKCTIVINIIFSFIYVRSIWVDYEHQINARELGKSSRRILLALLSCKFSTVLWPHACLQAISIFIKRQPLQFARVLMRNWRSSMRWIKIYVNKISHVILLRTLYCATRNIPNKTVEN